MIKLKTICFDVDGTLVDSKNVIINAANHTLKKLGFGPKKEQGIMKHMGLDTSYLISKITGSDDNELIIKGVSFFTDYWAKHIITDSNLFEGVIETLEYLKDKDLIITSNGIEEVIKKMLDNFNIKKYFKKIISGDEPDCIKPTACPINMVFDYFKVADVRVGKDNIMIVGDTDVDIKAGKQAGIKTCEVTYGMGQKDSIAKTKPDFTIDSFSELKDIIK